MTDQQVLTPGGFRSQSLVHRIAPGFGEQRDNGVHKKVELATNRLIGLPKAANRHACLVVILGATAIPAAAFAQGSSFDKISESHPNPETTVFRIDSPNPTRPTTDYRKIAFHRGDQITLNAGGCVQTGGRGKTWKSYTNPQGGDADHLYSGTVFIPGVIPLGPDGTFVRIGGWNRRTLRVPEDLPPTIKDSDLTLHLGYQDDNYGDNGYWGHDDGNNDQCKGIGNAFIVVEIKRNTGPIEEWTPRSRPFDLSWRTQNIDANGLPVNAFWGGQFDPAKPFGADPDPVHHVADFMASCAPAFSWNWGHHGMDEDITRLNATCTSQSPTTDFDHSAFVEPCCYCHPQPLSGHLDWAYGTYTGEISWEQYSGDRPTGDTDMNFRLRPTAGAGVAKDNGDTLGLEIESGETVDNFTNPFWTQLKADGQGDDAANQRLHQRIDGHFAVVTGLVGIDGVHGGSVEIHPVTAMAICMSGCTEMQPDHQDEAVVDGAEQRWVFFITNFGSGGNCSSSEHFWPGLNDQHKRSWYFLSLPWPERATSVSVSDEELHATGKLATAKPKRWRNWAFMGFELPDPRDGSGSSVDGAFTLHYTMGGGPKKREVLHAPPPVHRTPEEEGADLKAVASRISDPATRAKLTALSRSQPVFRPKARPHAVRLSLGNDPGADEALATVTSERARRITSDKPYVEADREAWKSAFFREVVKIVPLRAPPPPVR